MVYNILFSPILYYVIVQSPYNIKTIIDPREINVVKKTFGFCTTGLKISDPTIIP